MPLCFPLLVCHEYLDAKSINHRAKELLCVSHESSFDGSQAVITGEKWEATSLMALELRVSWAFSSPALSFAMPSLSVSPNPAS